MPSPATTRREITRLLQKPTKIGNTPINAGDVVLEDLEGSIFRLVISVAEFVQAIGTVDLGFGRQIFTFASAGRLKIMSTRLDISIVSDGVATVVDGEAGIGTVVASGAVAVLGGTATFENGMIGDNGVIAAVGAGATLQVTGTDADKTLIDGTSAAPDLFLNIAVNGGVAGNLTISGTIEIIGQLIEVHA
jgi:hypothetical protein